MFLFLFLSFFLFTYFIFILSKFFLQLLTFNIFRLVKGREDQIERLRGNVVKSETKIIKINVIEFVKWTFLTQWILSICIVWDCFCWIMLYIKIGKWYKPMLMRMNSYQNWRKEIVFFHLFYPLSVSHSEPKITKRIKTLGCVVYVFSIYFSCWGWKGIKCYTYFLSFILYFHSVELECRQMVNDSFPFRFVASNCKSEEFVSFWFLHLFFVKCEAAFEMQWDDRRSPSSSVLVTEPIVQRMCWLFQLNLLLFLAPCKKCLPFQEKNNNKKEEANARVSNT